MKKFIMLLAVFGIFAGFATGCADVAPSWSEAEIGKETEGFYSAQVAETAAPMEEGFYMVEGKLNEIGKSKLLMETGDGQSLYFKLAPETIIYAGENKEISVGQNIRVVFDGELTGEEIENVSVIAVTLLEE